MKKLIIFLALVILPFLGSAQAKPTPVVGVTIASQWKPSNAKMFFAYKYGAKQQFWCIKKNSVVEVFMLRPYSKDKIIFGEFALAGNPSDVIQEKIGESWFMYILTDKGERVYITWNQESR